ncbi:MAG TPA: L,D-transpeptidase family protein [Chitinophagaceae bacterium]|nr:L,D-transpeptidase family protein [Chitinophagaceae bacterium]
MKNILLYSSFLCCLFVSCNAQESGGENSESAKTKKNISKRQYSITKAVSYSDLFLDSMAVEGYISEKNVPDTLARRIRSFYNTRNYQFAWFATNGLTEQARGFWNLHDYHTTYNHDSLLHDKQLQKTMDNLITEENLTVSAGNKTYINTELKLTLHFLQYMLNEYEQGFVKRKEMERFIPRKKEDPILLADSILTKKHKDNKYFEDVNESYGALKQYLARYVEIARKGGWPTVTADKKSYKRGVNAPVIAAIKQHLQITGDMPGADTTQVFNDTLELAIKNYQRRFGYTADGVITASLIKEMNVPVQQRLQQIIMNMERMRWMPSRPSGDLILVNIPEFVLHVYDGKNKAWTMNVVVGKEGHNTMMFTGDLNQVVFSPYWNVPPSIVKSEILPALAKDPSYLAKNNMEQTGTEGGLPVIRQLPGPGNSLGRVKFLFPNSFNIYFHDTNAKSLFNKDKRAYSHGCIRLAEPEKMAQYLLRHQPDWTPERISEAMNSGKEKFVKLKDPIPVFITYYTSWVDENNQLNFREDIYKHDQKLAAKMFAGAMLAKN